MFRKFLLYLTFTKVEFTQRFTRHIYCKPKMYAAVVNTHIDEKKGEFSGFKVKK